MLLKLLADCPAAAPSRRRSRIWASPALQVALPGRAPTGRRGHCVPQASAVPGPPRVAGHPSAPRGLTRLPSGASSTVGEEQPELAPLHGEACVPRSKGGSVSGSERVYHQTEGQAPSQGTAVEDALETFETQTVAWERGRLQGACVHALVCEPPPEGGHRCRRRRRRGSNSAALRPCHTYCADTALSATSALTSDSPGQNHLHGGSTRVLFAAQTPNAMQTRSAKRCLHAFSSAVSEKVTQWLPRKATLNAAVFAVASMVKRGRDSGEGAEPAMATSRAPLEAARQRVRSRCYRFRLAALNKSFCEAFTSFKDTNKSADGLVQQYMAFLGDLQSEYADVVVPLLPVPTRSGMCYVVGSGDFGQLGLGEDVTEKKRPTPLDAFGGPRQLCGLACGGMHTAALDTEGRVWTWGVNDDSALGRTVRRACVCASQKATMTYAQLLPSSRWTRTALAARTRRRGHPASWRACQPVCPPSKSLLATHTRRRCWRTVPFGPGASSATRAAS